MRSAGAGSGDVGETAFGGGYGAGEDYRESKGGKEERVGVGRVSEG